LIRQSWIFVFSLKALIFTAHARWRECDTFLRFGTNKSCVPLAFGRSMREQWGIPAMIDGMVTSIELKVKISNSILYICFVPPRSKLVDRDRTQGFGFRKKGNTTSALAVD